MDSVCGHPFEPFRPEGGHDRHELHEGFRPDPLRVFDRPSGRPWILPFEAIKEILEREKMESSIYIMVDTLYYLKKGGRITPAAAALGTLLKLKPVLQIQGEKLDSFAKARTVKQAKKMMIDAMRNDFDHRFNDPEGRNMYLEMAYTHNLEDAEAFKKEVEAEFPGMEIVMNPLSLSVSCHIGPGALAVACSKKIPELTE